MNATTRYSTFVRDINEDGCQKLWKLSEPSYLQYRDGGHAAHIPNTFYYVVTSISRYGVSDFPGQPECYIFPASDCGAVLEWIELPGSMKNTMDHVLVLTKMGFPPAGDGPHGKEYSNE